MVVIRPPDTVIQKGLYGFPRLMFFASCPREMRYVPTVPVPTWRSGDIDPRLRIETVAVGAISTVRQADRICVLEHGKAIELGTHEELMSQSGRYAELFELQAAGYR